MQGVPAQPHKFRLERLVYQSDEPTLIASVATPEEIAQRRIRVLKRIYERDEFAIEGVPGSQPLELRKVIEEQHQPVIQPNKFLRERHLEDYQREGRLFNHHSGAAQHGREKSAAANPVSFEIKSHVVQPSPKKKSPWGQGNKQADSNQTKQFELFGMPRHSPTQAPSFSPSELLTPSSLFNFNQELNKQTTSVLASKNFYQLDVLQSNRFNEEEMLNSSNKNKEEQQPEEVQEIKPTGNNIFGAAINPFDKAAPPSLFSRPEASKECTGPNVKLNIATATHSLFNNPLGTPPAVASSGPALTTNNALLFVNTAPTMNNQPSAPVVPSTTQPIAATNAFHIPPYKPLFSDLPQNLTVGQSNTQIEPKPIFQNAIFSSQEPAHQETLKPNSSLFGNFGKTDPNKPVSIPDEVKNTQKVEHKSLFPSETPKTGLDKYEKFPGTAQQKVTTSQEPLKSQPPSISLFPSIPNTSSDTKPQTNLFGNPITQPSPTSSSSIFGTPPSLTFSPTPNPTNKPLFGQATVTVTEPQHGIFNKGSPEHPKLFPEPRTNIFNAPVIKNIFEGMKTDYHPKETAPAEPSPTVQQASALEIKPLLTPKPPQHPTPQPPAPKVAEEEPKASVQQSPAAKNLFDVSATSHIFGKPGTQETPKSAGFAQFKTNASLFGNVPQTNIFSNPSPSVFGNPQTSSVFSSIPNNPDQKYVFGGTAPLSKPDDDDDGEEEGDDEPIEQQEKVDHNLSTGKYVYESYTETLFKSEANHYRKNDNNEVFRDIVVSLEKTIKDGTHNVVIRLPKTNVVSYQGLVVPGKTKVDYMNKNCQNVKVTMVVSLENGKPRPDILKIQFREADKGEQFYTKMLQAIQP